MKRFHPIAGRGDHSFDLMVLAFGNCQLQLILAGDGTRCGCNQPRLVLELNPGAELFRHFW